MRLETQQTGTTFFRERAESPIEEEVRGPHHRAGEGMFQKSFFKFLSTISIAVFLEGLVLVFKVSQDDIHLLIYPVFLLFVPWR